MDSYPPPLPTGPTPRPAAHPARGWLLIILGVGLSVAMAYFYYSIQHLILQNDRPGTHGRWNGSPEFTRTTFELFGTLFVFGLVAIAGGIHIVRTRRINRVLGAIMIFLVLVIAYLGYNIIQTPSPR